LDENGNPIETDLVTVWDMEAKGWRSFNFSKVIEIV
jgi:protocatechuate 3,4-dioxygenase beta subunit